MSKSLSIDKTDYINAINLQAGIYNPLKGFVTHKEFKTILLKNKIYNTNFTIPINLFCSKSNAEKFKINDSIDLKYKNEIIGFINLKSKFKIQKKNLLRSIFGTSSNFHLGVNNYSKKIKNKNFSLGGKVFLKKNKIKKFFYTNIFTTLKKLQKNEHLDACFSTRNIPHIGHNLIQKKIIEENNNLSIFLILGIKNKYDPKTLLNSYRALRNNKSFKKLNIFFIYLPTFYAGPNEAFFQAKVFENMKFKYFYVGRDHAGYKKFYNKYASQKIFNKMKLKIEIIKYNEPMMCKFCLTTMFNNYKNLKFCPKCNNRSLLELNGSDVKILIKKKNKNMLSKMLDKFVYKFLEKNNFSLQTE